MSNALPTIEDVRKLANDSFKEREAKEETEFVEAVDYMVGFIDGFQKAASLTKQREGWVRVEDGLPEYGIGVLLIISTGMMTIGYLKKKSKVSGYREWQLYGELNSHMVTDPFADHVTHWMKLPPKPENI